MTKDRYEEMAKNCLIVFSELEQERIVKALHQVRDETINEVVKVLLDFNLDPNLGASRFRAAALKALGDKISKEKE